MKKNIVAVFLATSSISERVLFLSNRFRNVEVGSAVAPKTEVPKKKRMQTNQRNLASA